MSGTLTTPPAGWQSTYAPGLVTSGYTDAQGQIHIGYAPPTQLPVGAGQYANQVPGAAVGGTGSASTPGTPAGNSLTTWGGYLGELFKRLGVGALGVMLILLALFFMFADAAVHEFSSPAPKVPHA